MHHNTVSLIVYMKNAKDFILYLIIDYVDKLCLHVPYHLNLQQFDNTIIDILTKSSHIKKKNKKSTID